MHTCIRGLTLVQVDVFHRTTAVVPGVCPVFCVALMCSCQHGMVCGHPYNMYVMVVCPLPCTKYNVYGSRV